MDIKVVVTNGIGYLKQPIPPATYQVELIHLSDQTSSKQEKSIIHRKAVQITIDKEHPMLRYNPKESGQSISVIRKRTAQEPMTNLLYLALCCAESAANDGRENKNSFYNMSPYLEQYIYANSLEKWKNFESVRLEQSEEQQYYRFVLADYMKAERKIQDGILIIRDVPNN